jgi:hypothetical protein
MDTQIDPQVIINDLLDQIKRLTLDNSMLRAYIQNSMNTPDEAQVPEAAPAAFPAPTGEIAGDLN